MSKTGDRAMTMAVRLARENTQLKIALGMLTDAAKDVLEDIDWTAFNPPNPSEVQELAAAVAEASALLEKRRGR